MPSSGNAEPLSVYFDCSGTDFDTAHTLTYIWFLASVSRNPPQRCCRSGCVRVEDPRHGAALLPYQSFAAGRATNKADCAHGQQALKPDLEFVKAELVASSVEGSEDATSVLGREEFWKRRSRDSRISRVAGVGNESFV